MVDNENSKNVIKIFDKYIKNNKINHAYLIETNIENRIELAKLLISKILSVDGKNNEIMDLYKNGDLKFISTNAQSIKKEDIIKLKEDFKTSSIYNDIRIYVIEEAEKLNASSSNTLLKFLEEPNQRIIAILITSNKNKVINTIVSRCQIIRAFIKESSQVEENSYYNNLFEFLLIMEEKKEKSIAYFYKFYKKDSLDRNSIKDFMNSILYIYDDVLNYKFGENLEHYEKYKDYIKKISDYNDVKKLQYKISILIASLESIKFNPNIRLTIDKMIIEMNGVDKDV